MTQKSISELSNEKILRQQLELLAERSEKASNSDLPMLTIAMMDINKVLENNHHKSFDVEINIPDGMRPSEVVNSIKKQLSEYVSKLPLDF